MEHENSPPPAQLYNGPPLSWSEPTIGFHDKYFITELKVTSSLTDMPNFDQAIDFSCPVLCQKKETPPSKKKKNNNNGKQTNKSYSYRLFYLIPWYKYL